MTFLRTNPKAARCRGRAVSCVMLAILLSAGMLSNALFAQQKTVAKTAAAKPPAAAKTEKKMPAGKSEKQPGGLLEGLRQALRRSIPAKPPARILPRSRTVIPVDEKDDKRTAAELLRARDHIDSRAPHDPDDIKRLQRAEALIQTGDWIPAIKMLQLLLDRKDDTLIRTPQDKWVSVRVEANHLLGRVPQEIRDTYRLQYGATASQLLEEATKSPDERTLADVATRYFHTPAGLNAARRLSLIALNRGDYGVAARWFARVRESKDLETRDPQWLLQAAYAFRRSGDIAESERILKEVEAAIGNGTLRVAGKTIRPAEWLHQFEPVQTGPKEVTEWWTAFGTPSRTGTVKGGEPLLLTRWSQPTTHSHTVFKQIETVNQALTDSRRALIPAAIPLTVNGKVVFRTLRGVLVVDAETGKALWETREGISAELLLSGRATTSSRSSRFGGGMVINRFGGSESNGTAGDYHPLTGLLYRDGVYGMLSSDGRQLFVIEEQALLPNASYGYGSDPEQYDNHRRSWMTSKLVAYDLDSGRPNWEVGGRSRKESFDLPLAGNYFFGVPVADGGELFVIGEQDSRIRLHAIDAKTGKPKWSRLIAYSDTKISRDFVRREFVAQPTVSDGVIICPTGVGWMVAVDRSNQSILWAHRYAKPQSADPKNHGDGRAELNVAQAPLNSRWLPSAPVITSGCVVYTPQEDDAIVCLRLRDGKQLWRIPQSDYLYLAGVFGERVVLVGKKNITAVTLSDGITAWTQPLDASAGLPSGMGVAVGDRYHLPLQNGQLWTFHIATGKVGSKLYMPRGGRPLGNLTMYRDQVLSLTPLELASYEQRDALIAKINERKKEAPDDAWSALKEAEIALLRRDHAAALTSLRTISSNKLNESARRRFRAAMMICLTAVIRSDFSKHDDAIRELESLAKTPDERFALRRLMAERFDARKNYESALALYQQLADEHGTRLIQRADDQRVELTVNAWVAGKLHDLWQRSPVTLRTTLDAGFQANAETLAGQPLEKQIRFCERLAFHPVAATVMKRLIRQDVADGRFARAEQMILRLRENADRTVAASATEQLARLLHSHQLSADSRFVYEQLRQRYANVVLDGGKTAAAHVADLESRKILDPKRTTKPVSWGGVPLQIESSGTQYVSHPDQELVIGSSPFPFFREHSFQIDHNAQQLIVTRTADQSLTWLVPLRARQGASNSYYVFGTTNGHLLLVLHRGVLHCLSPVDRRVVWTKPLDDDLQTNRHYFSYYSTSPLSQMHNQPMQGGSTIGSAMSLAHQANFNGGIAFANEDYLGISGKRRLVVLNARTGEVVWTYRGLMASSHVVGTREAVLLVPKDDGDVIALRAVDGKHLTGTSLAIAKKAVAVVGSRLLVADVETKSFLGFSRSTTTWKLQNPLTGDVAWKRDYESGTLFSLLDNGDLAALKKHGQLEMVNREDGRVQSLTLPAKTIKKADSLYLMTDRNSLFLVANTQRNRTYYHNGGLATIPVNGTVTAIDQHTGKTRWSQSITNENIVTDQFAHSPVLMLSTRKYINKGLMRHMSLTLVAIDKQTGKRLLDTERASNDYYGAFLVNLPGRYLEFRTYNSRLRLVAESPAAKPAGQKPATKPSIAKKPVATAE